MTPPFRSIANPILIDSLFRYPSGVDGWLGWSTSTDSSTDRSKIWRSETTDIGEQCLRIEQWQENVRFRIRIYIYTGDEILPSYVEIIVNHEVRIPIHLILIRWWFQICFFMFTPNLGEDEPIWTSIFFRWVETTGIIWTVGPTL